MTTTAPTLSVRRQIVDSAPTTGCAGAPQASAGAHGGAAGGGADRAGGNAVRVGATPRRSRRRSARHGLHLTGAAAAAFAVAGLSGCGDDTSAQASTSAIGASDISRIAAGNKSRTSTSPATAASTAPTSPAAATSTSVSASPSRAGAPGGSGATSTANVAIVVPDAAKAHTKEGAKAFVKFYWETLDVLAASPRGGVLEQYMQPDCTTCKMQAKGVAGLQKEGAHIETNDRTLSEWAIRGDSVTDSVVITFHQTDKGNEKVAADGTRHRFAPNDLRAAVRADWTPGGWRLGAAGADKS